jgi:hypothetical protein
MNNRSSLTQDRLTKGLLGVDPGFLPCSVHQFDFQTLQVCIGFANYRISEEMSVFSRNAVLRPPGAHGAKTIEDVRPRGKAPRHCLASLPPLPKGQNLIQSSQIRDEEIRDRISVELVSSRLFFTCEFEARDAGDGAHEVLDRASHLKDEESFRRKCSRVATEFKASGVSIEDATQAIENGPYPSCYAARIISPWAP